MQDKCPLCMERNAKIIEKLSGKLLRKMYLRIYGVDIKEEYYKEGEEDVYLLMCENCKLKLFVPRVTSSEAFYCSLQKYQWYFLEEKDEYDIAMRYIVPATDKVLEIGAGRGVFAHRVDLRLYTGLEFSDNAIEMARQEGINLYKESIQAHAIRNSRKYDIVCAFQVLEHVDDVRGFIKAMLRCLRVGGKLILSVPSDDTFMGIDTNNLLNMPPHHYTRWTEECLRRMADIFGLKVILIEHEKLSNLHIRAYARAIVINSIRNIFGMKKKILDKIFFFFPIRLLVATLAMPLERGLRDVQMRPMGHSVTAIYETRQPQAGEE